MDKRQSWRWSRYWKGELAKAREALQKTWTSNTPILHSARLAPRRLGSKTGRR